MGLLLGLLPLPAGGCNISCACSTPPTHPPGWTPWPVDAGQAADTASRLTGADMQHGWSYEVTVSGKPAYETEATAAIAFVDAYSGAVLEAVIEDQMPDSGATVVSADAARAAAESFLAGGNISSAGLTEAAQIVDQPPVAFFDVTWTEPGASTPVLEILVNSSSGVAFAYRDDRTGFDLSIPVIGHSAAMKLAAASTYSGNATPDPEDQPQPEAMGLEANFAAGNSHDWVWHVQFPNGGLAVDATTGAVWPAY